MAGFGEFLDSWFFNQNLFYICKGLVSKIRHCRKPPYVSRQCSEPQKPTDKPTKTEIKSVNLRL